MNKKNFLIDRWKAFGYAIKGLVFFFKTEKSAWIHLFATLLVVIAGFYFNLSAYEWIAIVFAIGLVITTEIINTAIEELVNMIQPTYHPVAGKIKDFGAAAVLLTSFVAVIIACIVFIPKIMEWN